jgi:hypothetical protein
MTPYQLRQFAYRALEVNRADVADPGASGTIRVGITDRAICNVITAAAESRALESAANVAPGTLLTVVLYTDGGDLTLTGSDDGTITMTTVGDYAIFTVVNENGTHAWRTVVDGSEEADETTTLTEDVPLDNEWRVWDAIITNLAGADGTDDLGLVTGTYLTSNPTFNVTVATPTTAPFYARRSYVLPADYVAGSNLTVRINATETVAATTADLDLNAVDQDSPSTDICATAAQSIIGAAAADFDFVITGTNLVAGDTLDLRVSITLNDAAATPNYSINSIKIIRTVLAR